MKKVISALTAAAMCASMTASVMSASAVYTAADLAFELRVTDAGKGVISDGGKTVTFASAADAANTTLTIQEFILADTANPSVQQVASQFTTNTTAITFPEEGGLAGDAVVGEAEYTGINYKGETVTFKTENFVNTFDYLTKTGKYASGTGTVTWAHSNSYTAGFVGNDPYQVLSWQWIYSFSDNTRDNGKETAAFLGATSDAFPMNQFTANIGDITDGTYEITFQDQITHPEWGVQDCNWVNVDGKTPVKVTNVSGIKIVVGDGNSNPTETTPEDTKPTESTPTPTESTPTPTEPDTGDNENPTFSEWTWYIEDVYFDPETDVAAEITVKVQKDPGIVGFTGQLLMDGKTVLDNDWDFDEIAKGGAYKFDTFVPNMDIGKAAYTMMGDDPTNQVAEDGATIVTFTILPNDVDSLTVGTVYKMTLADNLVVTNEKMEEVMPKIVGGNLIIGKKDVVTPPTTEPTTDESKPTESTPEPTKPTESQTPSGDYLYGDVNENGKVELVDIVMLNRYLTGYGNQELTDRAVVNANCFRNGESDAETTKANLSGEDSIEILKYLIQKIASLPTQG